MPDLQFGGRVTLEFAGAKMTQCEAEIVLDPALFDKSSKTNADGTSSYMLRPKAPGADIRPRDDSGIDWNALLLKRGNATIVEETTGRTHLFTGTQLVGTPKVNLGTGEIDGLRLEGGIYRKLVDA
jgi:hypothetical protein